MKDENNFDSLDRLLDELFSNAFDARIKRELINSAKELSDEKQKNTSIQIIETLDFIAKKHDMQFYELFTILQEVALVLGGINSD